MVGQNLTYQVGVLLYPSTASTVAAAVTVPIVALAITVLVIIGVLVFMHKREQKNR